MTTKNNVTQRGESQYFDVCANHVEITMTRDELCELQAAIDLVLGVEKPCDVCERPHANCGAGCDGYGN